MSRLHRWSPSVPAIAALFLSALGLLVSGCSPVTFGAVNPTPYAEVPATAASYSLEVNEAVANDQVLDTITIRQFRTTLRNGFHNAAGPRYVDARKEGTCRLVVDKAILSTSALGNVGRFLTLQYRARWIGPDGTVIAELVGLAQPRNPTETRPRHLEDVVEVMYEQLIGGLGSPDTPAPSASRRMPDALSL